MRGSVTVQMAASPRVVWDIVSDVTRIGEFSPETFEARWTRGSTGPAVGAYFKGHVKRNGVGPVYWTLCRGTEVTESFELQEMGVLKVYWTLLGRLRGRTNERGMRATLERIKTVAEDVAA